MNQQPYSFLSNGRRDEAALLHQAPGPGGMTVGEPAAEYESLSGLIGLLRRRWKTIALVAGTLMLLGTIACLLTTPRYAATATIEVNPDDHDSNYGSHAESAPTSADTLKAEVQTDTKILQSDGLAIKVLEQQHLRDKKPFAGAVVKDEAGRSLDQAPKTRERMLKLFRKSLVVDAPADTRLITVTFENQDPAVAAATANALAQTFIDDYLERRHRSTTQASFWLKRELTDLKTQVEESEQRLADYERKTGMAGVQISGASNGEGSSSVAVNEHNTVLDRLFTLNQELTTAEATRISTEAVYQLVKTQNPEVVLGLGSMGIASGSSGAGGGALQAEGGMNLLRSLRSEDSELRREYASYASKYGEKNPRLQQLHDQIDTVDGQMQAELDRITRRAENALEFSRKSEGSIREQFQKQQLAANALADDTVQLQVLAQEAYSNRALYQNLFSKLQEASLSSGVRATRIDVVNEAKAPGSPSSPDYLKYLSLVFGVGSLAGIASAFLRESLDDSVRTSRDVELASNLSVLGYVPTAAGALEDGGAGSTGLMRQPDSPFAESFRSLRTSILLSTRGRQLKTLLVTSPLGGDGKTTVTYNLGMAFAQQGSRVLLLDADLRNPDLHRLFGCARTPGLADMQEIPYTGDVPGIVRHAAVPNLYMLPAGTRPQLPAEFLGSERFGAVLRVCAAQFDYVVIDSPPILPVTDAAILATMADAILAVLRSRSTTRAMVTSVAQALSRTRGPVLGFVFNGVHNPALDGFPDYSYKRKEGDLYASA